MALPKILFLLPFFVSVISEVTEKDLQEKLGIDVKGLSDVTWKELVNKNTGLAPITNECVSKPNQLHPCIDSPDDPQCLNDTQCDPHGSKVCNGVACICGEGYFPVGNGTVCEFRPKKELGELCGPKDYCYAAFAACLNGTCACRDGFRRVNDVCRPLKYDCPFKRPLMIKGAPWPCKLWSNDTCPKGYACLTPAHGERVLFLSPSDIEQSYCCPTIPNVNITTNNKKLADIFDNVCLYGKPYPRSRCLEGASYYLFAGIGLGPVCCTDPCLRHPLLDVSVLVGNGKCVTGREEYGRVMERWMKQVDIGIGRY